MSSALLAALAVCNLPLFLYPQSHLPDAAWPTHATIVLPQGWLQKDEQPFLQENGKPMLAQVEVVSRWPDGSPKWLHVHGVFHYAEGKPARYSFHKADKLPPLASQTPLVVSDDAEGIHIDTGVMRLLVPRPFVGIALIEQDGKPIVQGPGGPFLVDGEGTYWHTQYDREAEIVIEQQGPAQVTIKATGWYQTPEPREDCFCRFTTRIVAYAGSPMIRIDHATTFGDDMKKHAVAELGFKFALPGATSFTSSTYGSQFSDQVRAAYLAQLTDDRLYRIAQTGPDAERDIRHRGEYERSAGWFGANVAERRLTLLTKDFWQKCPKEVKIAPDELVYYAWPKHGDLAPPDPTATELHEIYKFKCFHTGKLLSSNLPEEYYRVLVEQKDTTECKPEYAKAANLHGASMRNEFALVVASAEETLKPREYFDKLEQLYSQNPTARVSPRAIAESGALGPVEVATGEFAEVERALVNGVVANANSISRYRDYGWAIYGNIHHGELMGYAFDGHLIGRPSLHRVWNNAHYQHPSTAWQLWGLDGDPRLLHWARLCTDNYASVGQVRYDKTWYQSDLEKSKRRPSVKYHFPGAFYHCKGIVPWGGRDYGMKTTDVDAALWGHWPDPSSLLYAWLFDADRWCKDGYDLWYEMVEFPHGGTRREINVTLVHAMNAQEYAPRESTAVAIRDMLHGRNGRSGLMTVPLVEQNPGPLFEPTWVSRTLDLFPDDERVRKFVVESADGIGVGRGFYSLALSTSAWQVTGDTKYLLRHVGTTDRISKRLFEDPTGRWQHYGLMPGPHGDSHFPMQWHRYVKALRASGLGLPKPPKEFGQYLCSRSRPDNLTEEVIRGMRILVLTPSDQNSPAKLSVCAAGLAAGDMMPSSMTLFDAHQQQSWRAENFVKDYHERWMTRPSGWNGYVWEFDGPRTPGLHTLIVGSHGIGIYQGLAGGMPECQTLQSVRIPNSKSPVRYACKHTSGWLLPTMEASTTLRFTARGVSYGSHVSVSSKGKQGQCSLITNQSVDIPLPAGEGPWQLEIYGDGTSQTEIEVHSEVQLPLLYGAKLEDLEKIRSVLLPEAVSTGRSE